MSIDTSVKTVPQSVFAMMLQLEAASLRAYLQAPDQKPQLQLGFIHIFKFVPCATNSPLRINDTVCTNINATQYWKRMHFIIYSALPGTYIHLLLLYLSCCYSVLEGQSLYVTSLT